MVNEKLEKLIRQISPQIDLNRDLMQQMDSIQIADLLNAIENEFAIHFPTAELIVMDRISQESLTQAISRRLDQNVIKTR